MANSLSYAILIAALSILSPATSYKILPANVGSSSSQSYFQDYIPYFDYDCRDNIDIGSSYAAAATFELADTNNDSTVTFNEFLQSDPSYNALIANIKAKFAEVDKNGDGSLTKSEQDAYVQRLKEDELNAQIAAANETIESHDRGDGKLQPAELLELLDENYSLRPKANVTINQVMDPFDEDKDKALNARELCKFENNLPYNLLESTYDSENYDSSSYDSFDELSDPRYYNSFDSDSSESDSSDSDSSDLADGDDIGPVRIQVAVPTVKPIAVPIASPVVKLPVMQTMNTLKKPQKK